MSAPQEKSNIPRVEDVPDSAPQTTPKGIGYGHPEYSFVQGLMELNGSVARLQAILEGVKQTTDETKSKVASFEKIIYAAGVVLVICIAIGGWMLTTAKDFAMTYYKATLDTSVQQTAPVATKKPKP